MLTSRDYIRTSEAEPHFQRTRKILTAHPEVRKLFGPCPTTALWTVAIVGTQFSLAILLSALQAPWWAILAVAYTAGAVLAHALFVIIHEATHNLVFKGADANRWIGMVANLPIVFPSAMGFRKFHLLHHRYQGELQLDADLAGPREAAWVGRSRVRKVIWLIFFWVVEGVIRPARLKKVSVLDGWTSVNLVIQVAVTAGVYLIAGWPAVIYLFLSLTFSIGPHPLGARWIQEHYVVRGDQETYSYYGPLNRVMFNVGYHNEHHDLMMIAWPNLPRLRAMAPEFYDPLYAHTSYLKLFWRFLTDRDLDLFKRVVRPDRVLTTDLQPVKLSAQHAGESLAAAAVTPGLRTGAPAAPAQAKPVLS